MKMGQTLTDNLVPIKLHCRQQPCLPYILLPVLKTFLRGAIPTHRPVVLAGRSSENTFMDELRDIDFSDILNEFNDNTAQVQNRQASMQANPQIFYGNVTVIHNLTINK